MASEDVSSARSAVAGAGRKSGRVATASPGLDEILHGGLPPDRLYLCEGDPGSGKTTLGIQFLLEGMRRGERGVYVTLSETSEELIATARSHGWSLDGITLHELSRAEMSLAEDQQNTFFHPSEVELNEATRPVLLAVEQTRPQRIVFDSLSEMRLLAGDPLRYRRQILALKQFFVGRACTVLLLDDRTSGIGDLQLQSIAHGVISLEQLSPDYGAERRRLRIVKMRGSSYRGGFHDFVIRTGGLEVFPTLVAAEHHDEFKRESIPSGIKELDNLLGGGIDRGTSTLIIGPAGAGKSAMATQYALAAAGRGERSAIFTFDENLVTFYGRADAMNMDIRKPIGQGKILLRQVDPAQLSPGEFAANIVKSVEQQDVRLVVIDSLNGYLQAMPDERFLTSQMHELLTYLNQQGVVTLLVMAQHGFMGTAMTSPVDVSYLADTVILLRYFEAAGAIRRAISVVKKRTGRHEDTIREMRLSASRGVEVGEPLTAFRGVLTGVPVLMEKAAKTLALLGGDDD
jgi:circadian clock protein KaiC